MSELTKELRKQITQYRRTHSPMSHVPYTVSILNRAEKLCGCLDDLLEACIEAKMLLETDPRYPGFKDCDCGHCTMCKVRAAIAKAKGE